MVTQWRGNPAPILIGLIRNPEFTRVHVGLALGAGLDLGTLPSENRQSIGHRQCPQRLVQRARTAPVHHRPHRQDRGIELGNQPHRQRTTGFEDRLNFIRHISKSAVQAESDCFRTSMWSTFIEYCQMDFADIMHQQKLNRSRIEICWLQFFWCSNV